MFAISPHSLIKRYPLFDPLFRQLCDEGVEERILVAHDIHTKHRLEEFGGHGYSHLLNTAVPKMLKVKGVTQSQIDKILLDNPAKALAYNPQ